ncbi:MAG TPA: acyl-CoA dehydrogenase family protein [Cyclobacteriaceae bacterium]|nr:acyl-CoA dehydrogenase family protein [Cyclobacteriaceae bacterium]
MGNFFSDNKHLKFHLTHPDMKRLITLRENNFYEKDKYDYAPIDFEDALDSYEKILEIVGDISANQISLNAHDVDLAGPKIVNNEVRYAQGTEDNYQAIKQAGLVGMALPRIYGGLNFSIIPYVMAAEIVSRADAGFANIWGLQDCAETINEFASEELKQAYLPRFTMDGATGAMDLTEPDAGSDLQSVQLKASYDRDRDAWLLNGVKRFITNGDADISLVLARSEEGTEDARGLSLFVYDRTHKAVTIRRLENKLGIKGSPTCELVFKDAPAKLIGDRKLGLIKYVMSLMNAARLGIGAQSVGIGEAAYREALKYANERSQFGKPIIQFPAVYEMLSVMKVKLIAMRSLLYETARFVDFYKSFMRAGEERPLSPEERQEMKKKQRLADVYTPMVKLVASEFCNQIAYDAIQVHGGTGFMKDFPVERIYRDARITSIYEGTSQLQVVAAIRGVNTGVFLTQIREYENAGLPAELEFMQRKLKNMTDEFEASVNYLVAEKNEELFEFHSRRLVELAGNIIMGYLLLNDAKRDPEYKVAAEVFIKRSEASNKEKLHYIYSTELRDLGLVKQ